MKFLSEMLLARRIQRGDREACAQLVRAHHAAVYRFLFHLCRDGHAAEDLTQETFTAAWQKIGGYVGLASMSTWLHRIAYRKFLDWDRRPAFRPATGSAGGHARRGGASPLDAVLADEWSRRLYQAVQRLDAADRDVVVLHYFQGLSYRQMAAVVGQPVGTVKWRLSAALGQLRSLIHEDSRDEQPRRAPAPLRPAADVVGAVPAAPASSAGAADA